MKASPRFINGLLLFLTLGYFYSCNNEENNARPKTLQTVAGGGHDTKYNFYHFTPKLITAESQEDVIFEIRNHNFTSSSPVLITSWGANITLNDNGTHGDFQANDNIFSARLSRQSILTANHGDALNRPLVGRIDLSNGYISLFAEVWNDNIPLLSVTPLTDKMQKTTNLVNIVSSNISPDTRIEYMHLFYEQFGDDFDFVSIIYPGFNLNRNYRGIKQNVTGIGITEFDNTLGFGSGGKLMGMMEFPNTGYYDGASVGYQHELGHCWVNFLKNTPFQSGIPHWPLSDLANGIMGYSPGGGQGMSFNFNLVKQSENTWLLESKTTPTVFTDLDLYLMGLMPPEEVLPHFVFDNQDQKPTAGAILTGPITTITIDDIIRVLGPRIPGVANSPKQFKIATIIISHEFLTAREMSFYDYYTKRAEGHVPVNVVEGYYKYISKPFFLSTGERASLVTTLK